MIDFARMVAENVKCRADAEAYDCATDEDTKSQEVEDICRRIPGSDPVVYVRRVSKE